MQPRTVHLFNQLHQKHRVFRDPVIVFQMDDDIARGGVFHDPEQRISAPVEIG